MDGERMLMEPIKVSTIEDFQPILDKGEPFLMFKHSLTCPISSAAYTEYQAYIKENPDVPTYYLTVQESRPLSNYIADTFSVKHESPQLLFFKNGEVVWHTSHWNITEKAIREVVNNG